MIFLMMKGGAGNQFSQYAFVRNLIHERGDHDELYIELSNVYATKNNPYIDNHLKWFNVYPYEVIPKPKKWIFLRLYHRCLCKIFKKGSYMYVKGHEWLCKYGLYSLNGKEYTSTISKANSIYVEGNYENPKYYDGIRPILLQEFTIRKGIHIRNNPLIAQIESKKSICVSVRKWPDCVVNERRRQQTIVFYEKAIDQIIKCIGNDDFQIIIFSNDIDWCRTIGFNQSVLFEEGENTIYEKLYMMSLCTHFVLSNSTFSWWAQYLSQSEEKIVVTPYCPNLGFFQYLDAPAGVKPENWLVLDAESGERVTEETI